MDTGPASGLTAMISVPDAAASNAAARIFCVIVSVVLGLMTLIFINASSPNSRPRSAQCRRQFSGDEGYFADSAAIREPSPGPDRGMATSSTVYRAHRARGSSGLA